MPVSQPRTADVCDGRKLPGIVKVRGRRERLLLTAYLGPRTGGFPSLDLGLGCRRNGRGLGGSGVGGQLGFRPDYKLPLCHAGGQHACVRGSEKTKAAASDGTEGGGMRVCASHLHSTKAERPEIKTAIFAV